MNSVNNGLSGLRLTSRINMNRGESQKVATPTLDQSGVTLKGDTVSSMSSNRDHVAHPIYNGMVMVSSTNGQEHYTLTDGQAPIILASE
jgi:hypothetical protein